MGKTDEEYLLKYKESLKSAWGYNDYNDWPIKFNSIMHLFLPNFTDEFLKDLQEIKRIGVNDNIITESFGNPARIYRIINPIIYGMKKMQTPLNRQREVVINLLKMVENMKVGSIYNEDGNNIILSNNEANSIINELRLEEADKQRSQMLHRFLGLLWTYTEAIFFRAHDVTKEIHGFYSVYNSDLKLLIRDYMNLRPKDLWPDISLPNLKRVTVYTIYKNRLDVSIDAYNHLFFNRGDYVDDLVKFAIICDGKEVLFSELQDLFPELLNTVQCIKDWAASAKKSELIGKYAEIYWYRKKALCDILGKNYRVPREVYEAINSGKPDVRWEKILTPREIDILISLLI